MRAETPFSSLLFPPSLFLLFFFSLWWALSQTKPKGCKKLGPSGPVLDGYGPFLCSLLVRLKFVWLYLVRDGSVALILVRIGASVLGGTELHLGNAHQTSEKFGAQRLSSLLGGDCSSSILQTRW